MKYILENTRLLSMVETINKMKAFCLEGEDKDNLDFLSLMLMSKAKGKDITLESLDTQKDQKYTIAPPDELRKICIDYDLFTCADVDQYDRFFDMNESGANFNMMASYAYACSDVVSYEYVRGILESTRDRYLEISQDSYELDN